jgi:hypothetical protein
LIDVDLEPLEPWRRQMRRARWCAATAHR